MPKIITTVMKAPKRTVRKPLTRQQESQEFEAHKRREAMRARSTRQLTVRSDGVTRCSKCPPKHCCPDCARINNARQVAGLIRPKGDPRPHPNNCVPCIPQSNGYLGGVPLKVKQPTYEVVSIDVKPLGAGWYLAQSFLGTECIYERKVRGEDAARRQAIDGMVMIKQGLAFERALADA